MSFAFSRILRVVTPVGAGACRYGQRVLSKSVLPDNLHFGGVLTSKITDVGKAQLSVGSAVPEEVAEPGEVIRKWLPLHASLTDMPSVSQWR